MTLPKGVSRTFLSAACGLVILISCLGAFRGLDASSLWTDELFTAYFADPAQPDLMAALTRAAEDVNPPGYYLLVWAVLKATGADIASGSRAVSALLGVAAVLVLLLAPERRIGWTARLLAGVVAVSGTIWFDYTQEARTYTLVILLLTAALALALRLRAPLREGRAPPAVLAGLALGGLAASLSHYYAILVVGALYTGLLVQGRSGRALAGVLLSGLAVLIPFLACLAWLQARNVVDIHDTWFSTSVEVLWGQARAGLGALAGGRWAQAVLAGIVLLALVGRRAPAVASRSDRGALVFLGGVFGLSYLYALAVTFGYTPMLSTRFFNVLAPLVWLAVAYLAQEALDRAAVVGGDGWARLCLAGLVLLSGARVLDRGEDRKEPWRHSARAVAALEECGGASLPVVWFEQVYFAEDDPARFYGHYLPGDMGVRWLPLDRSALSAALQRPDVTRLLRDTAAGRRACPLVLWSVHMDIGHPDAVADLLSRQAGGVRVSYEVVRPDDAPFPAFLFLLQREAPGA